MSTLNYPDVLDAKTLLDSILEEAGLILEQSIDDHVYFLRRVENKVFYTGMSVELALATAIYRRLKDHEKTASCSASIS